ncbi:MAG: hypothetical protein Tsb0016_01220 [Sphingomonadales bacterium]
MKVDIVRVGNSKGIRIPKAVLEQCGFAGAVEMTVEDKRLVLSAARPPRAGWAEAFEKMAAAGDDAALLSEDDVTAWDRDEWRW